MVEINNNVKLNELYNNKTWIHGNSCENINITVFLITIEGSQLKYALDSINNLNLSHNILVNVIMNISPTSKAYNCMIERCDTSFFIQMDEDMEFLNNSIEIINNNLRSLKKYYVQCYHLIDDYLGINNPPVIFGMKVYNNNIMKKYPIQNNNNSISSVDQYWQKQINKDGYSAKMLNIIIGHHAKHREPFDLLLRYCKITQSVLNPKINSHNGDKPKLLKPMNSIENFNKLYVSIIAHFLEKKFDLNIFLKNNNILIEYLNIYSKSFKNYNIKYDYISIDKKNKYENNLENINYLVNNKNTINKFDLFSIIGIVNSLFENYEYDFNKYPYEIYEYFLNI